MAPPELPDYEPRERKVTSGGLVRLLAVIICFVVVFGIFWWWL